MEYGHPLAEGCASTASVLANWRTKTDIDTECGQDRFLVPTRCPRRNNVDSQGRHDTYDRLVHRSGTDAECYCQCVCAPIIVAGSESLGISGRLSVPQEVSPP